MMFPTKKYAPLRLGKYGREPFDPQNTFAATKTMICNGKLIKADEVFDKTLVNTRRLRQMYEHRMLKVIDSLEVSPQAAEVATPTKPDFLSLSNEGLQVWLRGTGYIPKPRTHRAKLLELCEQKWKEYIDVLTAPESNGEIDRERVSGATSEGNAEEGNSRDG